jgi:hypothetical protein
MVGTLNENLLKRRQKLLNFRNNGVSLPQAVKSLSDEFKVSQRQIYYDWKTRERWMGWFIDLGGGSDALRDVLARHESIFANAAREYRSAGNDSARIGALRLMRDIDCDVFEFMVTGDLVRRVEKLEEVKGIDRKKYR